MGCYGIGVGRLLATIVEIHHDEQGITWPVSVAPFRIHMIPLNSSDDATHARISHEAMKLYEELTRASIDVLFDDRQEASAGEKFKDADLIGIPYRVVISEKTLSKNSLECKNRITEEMSIIGLSDAVHVIKEYVCAEC